MFVILPTTVTLYPLPDLAKVIKNKKLIEKLPSGVLSVVVEVMLNVPSAIHTSAARLVVANITAVVMRTSTNSDAVLLPIAYYRVLHAL